LDLIKRGWSCSCSNQNGDFTHIALGALNEIHSCSISYIVLLSFTGIAVPLASSRKTTMKSFFDCDSPLGLRFLFASCDDHHYENSYVVFVSFASTMKACKFLCGFCKFLCG
jgi:hypothetical protein